jgi:hypothetical protein
MRTNVWAILLGGVIVGLGPSICQAGFFYNIQRSGATAFYFGKNYGTLPTFETLPLGPTFQVVVDESYGFEDSGHFKGAAGLYGGAEPHNPYIAITDGSYFVATPPSQYDPNGGGSRELQIMSFQAIMLNGYSPYCFVTA